MILAPGHFGEANATGRGGGMVARELLGLEEERQSPGRLPADGGALLIVVGPGQKKPTASAG